MTAPTTTSDLSTQALRDRLASIAAGLGLPVVAQAAAYDCMNTLVRLIIDSGKAPEIVRAFFAPLPHGEKIAADLLSVGPQLFPAALRTAGNTLVVTQDPSAVKAVCRVASALKGRLLESALGAISDIAFWTQDPSAVKAVCRVCLTLTGNPLVSALQTISNTAQWAQDPSAVKAVCRVCLTLKGKPLASAMEAIFNTAYETGDSSAVRKEAAKHLASHSRRRDQGVPARRPRRKTVRKRQ